MIILACNCNRDGSKSLECDEDGRCVCKDGVLGYKCDQCQENFYDLVNGCKGNVEDTTDYYF